MATDLPTLLGLSKSKHIIQDKSTGQVLGYAFFITDQQSSTDQVQLVPYEEDEGDRNLPGYVHTHAGRLAYSSPPAGNVPGIHLVSDLDLSDSSTNETFENDSSQNVNEVEKNQGHNLQTSPNISKPCGVLANIGDEHQTVKFSTLSLIQPTSSSILKETPNMLLIPAAASTLSHNDISNPDPNEETASSKLSPVFNLPNLIHSTKTRQEGPDKLQSLTKSIALDIVSSLNRQSNGEGNVSSRKRTLEDHHETRVENKRLDNSYNFSQTPGMNSKYEAFYEHVSEEGLERKYRRVRCLLCADGKVLSLGNFNRHARAIHEPPEKCENCGSQFSGQQIKVHRRTCRLNMNNNSDDTNKCNQYSHSPVGLPQENMKVDCPESNFASCVKKSQDDLLPSSGSSESLDTPALVEQTTDSDWAFLVLASVVVEKARIKIKVKKEAKIKKAMKSFGKHHNVDYKNLKFLIGGAELTGEEIVGDIEGNIVDVYGEISN